jgi:hypothetical protein
MRSKLFKKSPAKQGLIILILGIVIYLLMQFANYPQAVERYYSNGVYRFICGMLHPLLNIFPFSVGDLIYLAVIAYLLYTLFRIVKLALKRRFAQAGTTLLKLVIAVQLAIIVFYILWGMNYFRPPASERLNLKDSTFTKADLEIVTAMLIDSVNMSRASLTQADLQPGNDTIYKRAINAVSSLSNSSAAFKTYKPNIKPSLLTPLMNYLGTSGYYNPFTTEAQMNYQLPVYTRPFVACHEMAHQMGYGAEDEANFAGFMAAIHSKDKLLRYSAYYLAVQELMYTMRGADTILHKRLKATISSAVRKDYKAERLYWLSYQNKINAITSVFYDNFLKVNNQPEGLDTYNHMVTLVIAYYRQKELIRINRDDLNKKSALRISPRNALNIIQMMLIN